MPQQRSRVAVPQLRASLRIPDNNDASGQKTGSADKTNTLPAKSDIAPRHRPVLPPRRHSSLPAPKSSWISHHLLLHLVDSREMVLEIINAEEKRHHSVER